MNLRKAAMVLGMGFAVSITPVMSASAATPIPVYVNGAKQTYDQPPIVKDNRTLVPIRGISEDIGATVNYNAEDQTVSIKDDKTEVRLKLGSQTAYINDVKKKLDVPAQAVNNRTMVPLRFVGEAFGAGVSYNSKTGNVSITSPAFSNLANENREKIVTIFKMKHGERYIYEGAGVIVSPSLVLTTQSAVNNAEGATIKTNDGKEIEVEGVVEMDYENNLALIMVESPLTIEPAIIDFSSHIEQGQKAVSLAPDKEVEIQVDGFENRFRDQFYTKTPYTNSFIGAPLFNYNGAVVGLSSELDLDHTIEYFDKVDEVKNWSHYFTMTHSEIKSSGFYHKLPLEQIKTISEISLGMDDTAVRALEKGEPYQDSYSYLSYRDDTIGPDGYVSYEFYPQERSLYGITYQYFSGTLTKNQATELFQKLADRLETAHGTPYELDTNWEDDAPYEEEITARWLPKFNEEQPVVVLSVSDDIGLDQYRFEIYYRYLGSYRK